MIEVVALAAVSFARYARRSLMTERSERMSEEAQRRPVVHVALTRRGLVVLRFRRWFG